jgi:branched-chain amino acid aminotransferase
MTTKTSCSTIWLDGQLIDATQDRIDPTDRGLTLGDGLFETMLWTGRDIRFFADHMIRLHASATLLDMVVPQSVKAIHAGLMALGQSALDQRATLRLTLSRGPSPRGLAIAAQSQPQIRASLSPFVPWVGPVSMQSVTITRNSGAPSARLKTLSYIDNIMALNQARKDGADDAVMLGTTGYIACASSANIVISFQGKNLTPALGDGALSGIVRGRLIAEGLIEEASLSPSQLAICDHAALTNALISVRPVGAIDGRQLEQNPAWIKALLSALDSNVTT